MKKTRLPGGNIVYIEDVFMSDVNGFIIRAGQQCKFRMSCKNGCSGTLNVDSSCQIVEVLSEGLKINETEPQLEAGAIKAKIQLNMLIDDEYIRGRSIVLVTGRPCPTHNICLTSECGLSTGMCSGDNGLCELVDGFEFGSASEKAQTDDVF